MIVLKNFLLGKDSNLIMDFKKVAAFSIGPIGGSFLGFITLPIITWYFSVEDVGRISMLHVVLSFAILVFSLGLDQAYVREYHESENKSSLLKSTSVPGFFLLLLFLVVCLFFPVLISRSLFSVDSFFISILVALCFMASFISRFLSLVLRMQERGFAYSMSQVLPKIIFLLVVGFYIISSFDFNLFYLVVAHTISIVTVALVYIWNTRKDLISAISQKIDFAKLKLMLAYGAPLIMGGAAFWGLTAMDRLFLRHLSTFDELGIYSVATSFAAAAIIFQSVFSTVWAPTVYKWAAEGINLEKIDKITEYVLAAVVFLFVLAGVFSWLVTYFLPDTYDRVQYIIVTCMAYPLFYTLSETTVIGLGITRKSSYAMLASFISVAVNFIGNYFLVPLYGAEGAAVSTAFSFWVFLVARTEFSCLVWNDRPRNKIYILTLMCLVSAVFTSIGGSEYIKLSFAFWILIALISCFLFKEILKVVLDKVFYRLGFYAK